MASIDRVAVSARQVAAGLTPVPSPCVSICRMGSESGLCEGCFRTLAEITQWSQQDDVYKRDVWALVAQRITAIKAATV